MNVTESRLPHPIPDGRPGFYYVTARDSGSDRVAFLRGPFLQRPHDARPDAHRRALGAVAGTRWLALRVFPGPHGATWAHFGTARIPLDAERLPRAILARITNADAAAILNGARCYPCRGCRLPMMEDPDADYCRVCAALNSGELDHDPAETPPYFGG